VEAWEEKPRRWFKQGINGRETCAQYLGKFRAQYVFLSGLFEVNNDLQTQVWEQHLFNDHKNHAK